MIEEGNRFEFIGRTFIEKYLESGRFSYCDGLFSLKLSEQNAGSHTFVLEVFDVRNNDRVAYSCTDNTTDMGRDLEEFSLDFFSDDDWDGPIEFFDQTSPLFMSLFMSP